MLIESKAKNDNCLEVVEGTASVILTIERKTSPYTRERVEVFLNELDAYNLAVHLLGCAARIEPFNIDWYPLGSEPDSGLLGISHVTGKVYISTKGTVKGSEVFGMLYQSEARGNQWCVLWDKLGTTPLNKSMSLEDWASYYLTATTTPRG